MCVCVCVCVCVCATRSRVGVVCALCVCLGILARDTLSHARRETGETNAERETEREKERERLRGADTDQQGGHDVSRHSCCVALAMVVEACVFLKNI